VQDEPRDGPTAGPVRPDYAGACLSRLIPAVLAGSEVDWLPAEVREADSAVVLLIDGLGSAMLEAEARSLPTIASLATGTLTTVVPSTTAAALTSLVTGAPPAEHGLVGYRMRVDDGILDVLKWKMLDGRDGASPASVAPLPAFAGSPIPFITRRTFLRTGGFTAAHLRGARLLGWKALSTLVVHCRQLAEEKEPLVVAYYDGVDWVAHRFGLRDSFFPAELRSVDRLVDDLLAALPRGTALLVTGDHGHVHLDDRIGLDELADLVAAYAGDARFRYLYARPGAAANLEAAASERFGDDAWVLSRARLIDEGWFGPVPPAPLVADRIGDVVLAARRPVAFLDPTHPIEYGLQSAHGSLTAEEMFVPLALGWGEGRRY
jgi:hypothetical protein